MSVSRLVCYGADHQPLDVHQGKLRPRDRVERGRGRPGHCRSPGSGWGDRGMISVQGIYKRWFRLAPAPPLPLCTWWVEPRVGTFYWVGGRSRGRKQLSGKHVQDLLGGMKGPGPLHVPGCGGRLGVVMGEGPQGGAPGSGCGGHGSSGTCLAPAFSERWHFPPRLESTPRLKLISLPLHNNNCAASPKYIPSLIAQNTFCLVSLGPRAPELGFFTSPSLGCGADGATPVHSASLVVLPRSPSWGCRAEDAAAPHPETMPTARGQTGLRGLQLGTWTWEACDAGCGPSSTCDGLGDLGQVDVSVYSSAKSRAEYLPLGAAARLHRTSMESTF